MLVVASATVPADADGAKLLATDANHIAIQGYDPVGYFTDGRAIKGSEEYEYSWDDARWRFTSAAHRDLFAADPDRYMPQYGGYCAGAMESGVLTPADPRNWVIVDGKLYMFRSKAPKEETANDISKADAHWSEAEKHWAARQLAEQQQAVQERTVGIGGYDAVAYFTEGRAVKGRSDFEFVLEGRIWYFASADDRDLFAADPDRYRPQYGGSSTMALSWGQDVPGNPEIWNIISGKLYFNHSALAAERMMLDSASAVSKADATWRTMQ
jgi:YHS domain-containing protein